MPFAFENSGYADTRTVRIFSNIKYGMSTGTALGLLLNQTRSDYARRMHVARTTISIAIARTSGTTAITLLQGAIKKEQA